MPRDAGCLTSSEMPYDNSSRVESKRGCQWFLDANGAELLSNKKQVIEAANSRPMSGISNTSASPWDDNRSNFQSVPRQFSNRLFGSEPESMRTINLVDVNDSSVGNGNMNMGREDFEDQFRENPPVSLSMTHAAEDPLSCLSFGGIRKVKVNEVRDSDIGMRVSMGHPYSRVDNSAITIGTNYSETDFNTISLAPTYNNGDENTFAMGPTFSKGDDRFSSMGQSYSYNEGEGRFIVMGQNYSKGDESNISMGQPLCKGDGNFMSMGQLFGKGPNYVMSMAPSCSKAHANFVSVGPNYSKGNENFIPMGSCYSKESDNITSTGRTYDKLDLGIVPIGSTCDKADSSILSTRHAYGKNDGNTISFGGYDDEPETNPSGGIISNYDLLMTSQKVAQNSEEPGQKDLVESNVEAVIDNTPKPNPKADGASKNKETKTSLKLPPNNFPANVKSLLSTGMLDGVRVKYVSWSREKNLHGIIKGAGYMCGCKDCQFSKALNAYEFERHAGCKTKHPNNHIYFENGKTIYAVVQELKNTPQKALFDVVQNVTGSSINQKNFRTWRASFQAAALELQRIYGKQEVSVPC